MTHEGDTSNRREENTVPPVYRARVSDVFATISLGAFIGAISLVYSLFRNVGQDADTKIKDLEIRVTKRIERIEDKLDKYREGRR